MPLGARLFIFYFPFSYIPSSVGCPWSESLIWDVKAILIEFLAMLREVTLYARNG